MWVENKCIKNALFAGSVAIAMGATSAVSEKHDSIATQAEVEANITGTASVSIGPTANVSGVIRFLKLAVSPGATISGELITMDETVDDNVVENQTST